MMALFSFGKKKEESSPFDLPPEATASMPSPAEDVRRMKSQGYSDSQIANALHTRGYSSNQVSDALTNAAIAPQQQYYAPQQNFQQQYAPQQEYSQPQYNPAQSFPQPQVQEGYSQSDERIEEIAEAIIDEKWQELVKDVKKVIEWKDIMETRLDQLEQKQLDLKSSMENMQKALFGKISDYDRSITDVGTEIKAMEKVFQKVLPTLTESVNRLDRISKAKK